MGASKPVTRAIRKYQENIIVLIKHIYYNQHAWDRIVGSCIIQFVFVQKRPGPLEHYYSGVYYDFAIITHIYIIVSRNGCQETYRPMMTDDRCWLKSSLKAILSFAWLLSVLPSSHFFRPSGLHHNDVMNRHSFYKNFKNCRYLVIVFLITSLFP